MISGESSISNPWLAEGVNQELDSSSVAFFLQLQSSNAGHSTSKTVPSVVDRIGGIFGDGLLYSMP